MTTKTRVVRVPRLFLLALSLLLVLYTPLSMLSFRHLTHWRAKRSPVQLPTNVVNLHRISFIQNISNIHRLRRKHIIPDEASQSIDTLGRNWIETQDHTTLFCLNLHEIVQKLGKTKPPDNRMWKSNNCTSVLRIRYDSW